MIARTGRRPRIVTADRGYGEARVENALQGLWVRTVVIPRKEGLTRPSPPSPRTAGGVPQNGEMENR